MRIGSIMVLLLLCSCMAPDRVKSPVELSSQRGATHTFSIGGELRDLGGIGKKSITVPWKESLTVEQAIKDTGGLTDFAWYIRLAGADRVVATYDVRSFMKDDDLRKTKVLPGMTIFIDREVY